MNLRARLLGGVSPLAKARDEDQQAKWLLAYLLDWHRREDKAVWWEYFRLLELPEDELYDEAQAIAGLHHVERVSEVLSKRGRPTGSVVDRYAYPIQEMEIRRGAKLKLQTDQAFGQVVEVDRIARTIDIQKGPKLAESHPTSAFEHDYVNVEVIEDAIFEIGEDLAGDRVDALALRLLRAEPPTTLSRSFATHTGETAGDFAVRVSRELSESTLAIQGPPGTGKTYTGARMICVLVESGKRVGVVATGHSVIRNLLDAVADIAAATGQANVRLGHKDDEANEEGAIQEFDKNETALEALTSGEINVLGGTAWLWARPEFAKSVDVLFVDEAGQMSLANVLAATRAAQSIVLLGDPQQLEQPRKGTHPHGVDVSALQHMLGDHVTISGDRGIFLPETWRLAPAISTFTSEAFYEGRLSSKPGLERQELLGSRFAGAGLWAVDVNHDGNRNSSDEEVAVVEQLTTALLAPGSCWVDQHGLEAQ
ncbi:MAG: AAA family ATPase, partial [Vicinamibacterales bacterium]